MPETIEGILEQKNIKGIKFEYDASDGSIILSIHVTPGIVDMLSKNMAKSKQKLTFPSLTFMESSVNIFE